MTSHYVSGVKLLQWNWHSFRRIWMMLNTFCSLWINIWLQLNWHPIKLASYRTCFNNADHTLVFIDNVTITVKLASNKIGIRLDEY